MDSPVLPPPVADEILRKSLAAADVGVWEYDADTETATADVRIADMFGFEHKPGGGAALEDFLKSVHPDDLQRLTDSMAPGLPLDISYRLVAGAGRIRWVRSIGRWGGDGGIRRLVGITIDITEERRRQEQLELIVGEMRHRIGNAFAILGGIVGMEAGSATSVPELSDTLRNRLAALSHAHSLSLGDDPGSTCASLSALISAVAEPFLHEAQGGLTQAGPDVTLNEEVRPVLGMLLYEWLTNALKYGALSVPEGTIRMEWEVEGTDLLLTWYEENCPPASPGDLSGFGTRMQTAAVARRGGSLRQIWGDDGLSLELRLPL